MQIQFSLTKEDIIKLVIENIKNKSPTTKISNNAINIHVIDEDNKFQSFKSIEITIKE